VNIPYIKTENLFFIGIGGYNTSLSKNIDKIIITENNFDCSVKEIMRLAEYGEGLHMHKD